MSDGSPVREPSFAIVQRNGGQMEFLPSAPDWAVIVLFLLPVSEAQTLSIYHIDVDQGDATLLVSPSGKSLLIDGGDTGKGFQRIVPLLRSLRISALDYTVATHYHEDHIGGLDEVVRALGGRVGVAFDRGQVRYTSNEYREYRRAVAGIGRQIRPGDRIDLGADVEVACVAAGQEAIGGGKVEPKGTDENANSIALLVQFREFDYFIGGDLTGGGRSGDKRTPNVERLVAEVVGDVDVLRASHHGSQTSSSAVLLSVLQPEVVVISLGDRGKNLLYHHPHRAVLARLRALPTLQSVFMTHRGQTTGGLRAKERRFVRIANGNIIVLTDGRSYSVNGTVFATDGVRSPTAGVRE